MGMENIPPPTELPVTRTAPKKTAGTLLFGEFNDLIACIRWITGRAVAVQWATETVTAKVPATAAYFIK